MDLTNLSDLRMALKLAGIKPNKELGQHFLIDRPALNKIVAAARINADDTVLEIGPGVGTLTASLVEAAGQVVVVEKDAHLADILKSRFPTIEVVAQDFMKFDLSALDDYKVVANLPYYITSKILQALLTAQQPPRSITVLVQKEVAERITAEPGQMSVLAFSVQYFGCPQIIDLVPAASFWPAPEVDSAILHIDLGNKPAFAADQQSLFRLVKAGFGERRKMLKNTLAGGLQIDSRLALDLLTAASISPTARAQELSMVQWQALYDQAKTRGRLD